MKTHNLALVAAIVAALPLSAQDDKIPVLLITGANNHDWSWTAPSYEEILEESGRFDVTITEEPAETLADAEALAGYRVLFLDYNGPRWGERAEGNFLRAVRGGAGVTVVHASNNAFRGWVEYETLVGLCWRQGTGHGRFHPFDVAVVDHYHPITDGLRDFRNHPDELYHRLVHMHGAKLRVLMSAYDSPEIGGTGRYEPIAIVSHFGEGRVFHTPLGHVWKNVPQSRASHQDPQFRLLVQRGTEWAATGDVTLPTRPANFLTDAEKAEGFRLLFNGRDLDGWQAFKQNGPPAMGWVVRNRSIVHEAAGGGGDLLTEDQFGDFDLRFSFKVAPGANSGVIYHVRETRDATWQTGPEFQVLDDAAHDTDARHACGALYDMVPVGDAALRPAGEWNEGRIVVKDGRVQHWLNGTKVVDCPRTGPEWDALVQSSKFRTMPEFGVHATGHIALQDHGDEVWYRDLRIKAY